MRLLYKAVAAGAVGVAGLTWTFVAAHDAVASPTECRTEFNYRANGTVEADGGIREHTCTPGPGSGSGSGDDGSGDDGYGGSGSGGNGGYGGPGGTASPTPSGSGAPTPSTTPSGGGGPAGSPVPSASATPSSSTPGGGIAGSPSTPGGGGIAAEPSGGGGGLAADGGGGVLAATGPSSGGLTALGILFIVGGAAVLWLNRGGDRAEQPVTAGGPPDGPAEHPYATGRSGRAHRPVPPNRAPLSRRLRPATPAQRASDISGPAVESGRHAADDPPKATRRRRPSPTPMGRHHA